MGPQKLRPSSGALWGLVARQHGVVTRGQLLTLGYAPEAIVRRIRKGRLHPVWRGVYAVGRPQVTVEGRWMAAVLSCGPQAALSHESAAALWEIRDDARSVIDVSVPGHAFRHRPGIVVHRRTDIGLDRRIRRSIPVTDPVSTLIDLALGLPLGQLEAAINAADRRDLLNPDDLRLALAQRAGRAGVAVLRRVLDRRTFRLTDSELERRFLRLVRAAGLPTPLTGQYVNGFKVDFYWPDLGLVVETDGLRYHRTPGQQARDRLRDQAHTAAGLASLRFTHAQVAYQARYVQETLAAVTGRLLTSGYRGAGGRPRATR